MQQKSKIIGKKKYRCKIPLKTQLKLWLRSGGICQFPPCRKKLWREGMTLREGNYSEIAHIVAQTPDGPRGDKIQSKELEKDYGNLMLLCKDHHHLIDEKGTREDFPEARLKKIKKQHEDFIDKALGTRPQNERTVLRFRANIQGLQIADIPFHQLNNCIFEESDSVPKDDKGVDIDLTKDNPPRTQTEWKQAKKKIADAVKEELKPSMDGTRNTHFAIFAMGPIPLLIELGRSIPNTLPADIYQRSRVDQNWALGKRVKPRYKYKTSKPKFISSDNQNVILKLSISGKVLDSDTQTATKNVSWPIYSIEINEPEPGLIQSADEIAKFGSEFQKLLGEIRTNHGANVIVHLFPAIPNAIAVKCGTSIIHKTHPSITVYDNSKIGFYPTITI